MHTHHLPPFDPTGVPNWQEFLYEPTLLPPHPDLDPPNAFLTLSDGTYVRLRTDTEALIHMAPHVGLPDICLDNAAEWIYRLWHFHDLSYHTYFYTCPDGSVPVRLDSPNLILAHVGLSFPNNITIPSPTFDTQMRIERMTRIHNSLPEVPPCPPPPTSISISRSPTPRSSRRPSAPLPTTTTRTPPPPPARPT